ncbi:MAG TPA: 4Fe-4S dicluster domain-containing protein [Acidobacteriota bacterium]|nr:4Fe-4S dicluster domain-containing protein [Acidobacteriota bacterium]
MARKGMLFDLGKCIACRSCQVACKQWNGLPAEKTTFFAAKGGYQNPSALSPHTWALVKFYEAKKDGAIRWLFRTETCMQCVDPSCVKACPVEPVKAMTHIKELGITYVNQELCAGCGACAEYCPFDVPKIDERTEKSTKCTGCADRQVNGLIPACAAACPTGALYFDDYDKVLEAAHRAKQRMEAKGKQPWIYGEKELGTGTHKVCVFPEPREMYPDIIMNPKVSEDLGFFRELMKPLGSVTLTAALVGMVIARVREFREKREDSAAKREEELTT